VNRTVSLLEIENLSVSFATDEGRVQAVDNVSLRLDRGETLGLVGESGCGKSVTALSILRLIPSPPGRIEAGRVRLDGEDVLRLPPGRLRHVRGRSVGMIFQEPMTALSPLHRVGAQLAEAVRLHADVSRAEAWRQAGEWLAKVGVPDPAERLYAYPHQLSGGMRQRVMIAAALMLDPDLIVADEPTTALDVTIQAQIFDLIRDMRRQNAALLLITHDMGVIWEMCDRVAVMYASEVVEVGPLRPLFARPLHPYTEALLASIPSRAAKGRRLRTIEGQVPSPLDYPAGCRFRERCPYAFARCAMERPALTDPGDGRQARCFLAEERARRAPEGKTP
jgi:peptide/nickel transport system ATP-binding protein/oligopeptide transport system ATP-binding protein